MRIAIGSDHAGFALKGELLKELERLGHEAVDCGAQVYDAQDDYPVFARAVAEAVQAGRAERGVVICGSGVGACVMANKLRGVRAAICHDTYSAHQGVEHDDMNVLCLGARIIGTALAGEILRAYTGARFSNEERHVRRLQQVLALEGGEQK